MAAKIKDGLFIGDAETSQSEIFINDNKISNLINLSGREVPNVWASHGLVYLTYNWDDRPDYRLFSGHEDSILTDIVEFVDVSIAHGISVLMFSKKGTGRAAVAACLYLMVKYRWGFEKSYDYVYSKKPDIDLNKGFIQQMFALDMKLVASRQKAYALKHGIENTFKIEPNMTINDIAAMLPPTEAKRWNSWDPSYVLTPNSTSTTERPVTQENIEEVVTWQKYSDSVISALRKKDQIVTKVMVNKQKGNLRALDDAEEELVLIFSFINAKNTISTLPGPYYNAYEAQKQFALRFDSVIFEEDVNWFPTSPTSSRYTYAPKGILKGGTRSLYPNAIAGSKNSSSSNSIGDSKVQAASNTVTSSNGVGRDDKHAQSPPTHIGLANPRNSIEIRSTKSHPSTSAGSSHHNTSNGSNSYGDDDLLKYVGVSATAQSKDEPTASYPSSSQASNNTAQNVAPPKRSTTTTTYDDKAANGSSAVSNSHIPDYDRKPMTAEERLRKLMADMERQKPTTTSSSSRPNNSSTSTGRTSGANNAGPASSASSAPSLYDLANMQVHASTTAGPDSSAYGRRSGGANATNASNTNRGGQPQQSDFIVEDFDEDDDLDDPLAAFDVPAHSNASGSRNSSTNVSGKTGALRARHDILSSTTGSVPSRPGSASQSSSSGGRLSLNNTTGGTRQQGWGSTSSNNASTGRYASPGSVRSSGTNNIPSSNSSIASQGSDGNNLRNSYVGSGSSSGTQVYRHGSPAPNNRPMAGSGSGGSSTRRTAPSGTSASSRGGGGSSNNSVGSERGSLSGVYGTGLGGSSTNNSSGRFSPAPSPSTSKSTRYSSPFSAAPSSNTAFSTGTPQRRSSNASMGSVGSVGSGNAGNNPPSTHNSSHSNNSNTRRTVGNASPLRASYSSNPSGSSSSRPASPSAPYPSSSGSTGYSSTSNSGVPAKRFSTPTPHDYENAVGSGSSRPGSASSAGRNNTPSKATWRF